MTHYRALFAAGLLALATTNLVHANSRNERAEGRKDDHEEARKAFQNGEIRSLGDILTDLRTHANGQVIEVELKRKRGAYIYEFKVLSPEGKVAEVELDAKTGRLIQKEAR